MTIEEYSKLKAGDVVRLTKGVTSHKVGEMVTISRILLNNQGEVYKVQTKEIEHQTRDWGGWLPHTHIDLVSNVEMFPVY